jgi:hypothetical protein
MKYLSILVCFFLVNSIAFSQELTNENPSIKNVNEKDSILYVVHIAIEAYSRTEIITVKKVESQMLANIKVISTKEEHNLSYQKINLNTSQIDTLIKFEKSIYSKKINHNQGIKIAGRIGRYFVYYRNEKYEFESRNLYGLLYALDIKN